MDIKLIATDVDGTLVANDHLTIPKVNEEALRKAKEQGITIVISTGRPYSLTDRETQQLGCVDYLILSNGAVILDAKSLQVLYGCYFVRDTAKKIVQVLDKYPLVYELYADCNGYINQYTYDHYFETKGLPQVFLADYRERMVMCDSPWDIVNSRNVEKINVDYVSEEYIGPMMEELNKIPGLVYSAGYQGNIEITTSGADKGEALKWLAHKLGIERENIMAFGDSGNDATMLKYAGCSYAMINGNAKAKEIAKHITKVDNEQGGVGHTISRYLTNMVK